MPLSCHGLHNWSDPYPSKELYGFTWWKMCSLCWETGKVHIDEVPHDLREEEEKKWKGRHEATIIE